MRNRQKYLVHFPSPSPLGRVGVGLLFLILNFSFLISAFSQNSLDQLDYNYAPNTNQLKYISDIVSSSASTADLDDQNRSNYTYNNIGQLTQDKAEGILDIDWTAAGKVKQVSIDDDNDLVEDRILQFKYDGMGNRIKKIETFLTTLDPQRTTFYLRNAGGELISIYENDGITTSRSEVNIAKLGIDKIEEGISTTGVYSRKAGNKHYELKDHLGNVRVVINDVKEPVSSSEYTASIQNATDYYSYGMQMEGRDYNSSDYRYGFNGMEKDDEVKGNGNSYDFGARIYDARIGQFLSTDRFESKFPYQSPYVFAGNTPINAIDVNGDYIYFVVKDDQDVHHVYGWNSEEGKKFRSEHIELEIAYATEVGRENISKYQNNKKYDVYISYSSDYGSKLVGGTTVTSADVPDLKDGSGVLADEMNRDDNGVSIYEDFEGLKLQNPNNEFALIVMNEGRSGFSNKFSRAGAFVHEIAAHVSNNITGDNGGKLEHAAWGETSTTNGEFDAMYQSPDLPAGKLNGELWQMNGEYFDENYKRTNGYREGTYTHEQYLNDRKNGTLQTREKEENTEGDQ